MKDKLVTLIGGGGFVGRYVAQELLKAGARVRIAQRRPRDAWFVRTLGGLGQTQFVAADVGRPATIANALAGADAVVNLTGTFARNAYWQVHEAGARTIAKAASAAGIGAMVHFSAIGADPQSPAEYGQSKAAGEAAVREAFPNATILRPSTLFGREDQFVNRFAGLIAAAPFGIVPVLRGEAKFQPAYVADVAEAVAVALADPGTHGGKTYELGGPDVLTMTELNRWIGHEIGRDPVLVEVPDAIGSILASLPGTPITSDQWKMLGRDTVVSRGAPGFEALGIEPQLIAAVAPAWLVRFRRNGRFGRRATA